jgi:hypothetical protein
MGEMGNPRKLLTTMTRNVTGLPGELPYSEGNNGAYDPVKVSRS